ARPKMGYILRIQNGTTTRGDDQALRLRQFTAQKVLFRTKAHFSVLAENPRHSLPGQPLNLAVGVYKAPPQYAGQPPPDDSLSGT
ncbi:hypothetical protein Q6325_28685, partial [Klebsiella pneumoniae]|nr:hypothetical protein [Klebsiella pneumoniae]